MKDRHPDDTYYSDTRGKNLFGYRVDDDSMEPQFRRGDIAVVNPNLSARPGDYVVALVLGETAPKALLRRMGSTGLLETLAKGHSPVAAGAYEVLGRVVERKRLYR